MQLPGPMRAAVGLMANAADEVKHLPDRAIELPMLAVSTALQMSLRAQQRYARLTARGDEVLNRRRAADEPPPWATFDEPVPTEDLRSAALNERNSPGPPMSAADLLDQLFGNVDDPQPPTAKSAPATKRATPAKKAPARKAAAKAPAKQAPASPATANGAATPAAEKAGKTVNKPRHTTPSRFDDAED